VILVPRSANKGMRASAVNRRLGGSLLPCDDNRFAAGMSAAFLGAEGRGRIRPEREWSFTKVEAITKLVGDRLSLADRSIGLWGHSAGAQFVHRFLLFKPRVKVRAAVVAGAGWYTVLDAATQFPYGLRHPTLRFSRADVRRFLRVPLTIMRGELDTLVDGDLRQTCEARAQGTHRFDRAGHMYARARQADPGCRWRLVDVPGVGHDWSAMAAATQAGYAAADEGSR